MPRSPTPLHRRLGACLLACALTLAASESIAAACGGFFSARALTPEQRPTLSREKVLIVHDAARGRQHFIREVAFRRADESFGFVVPTPTRPEIAKVERTPFTRLREHFPFTDPVVDGAGYGSGAGAGFGGRGGGVEVLAVEKVGSFTAFTLAATDAGALAAWLKDNDLVNTPETDRWLAHYVRMGFFYVALRYDPPANARARKHAPIAAETLRISFDAPIAYYPYFEPETPRDEKTPRLLELWYVGSSAVVPVARLADADDRPPRWVRPLQPGKQRRDARKLLGSVLLAELEALLPAGDLVVQTFQDQKRRRSGFQDILFAAAEPTTRTPEQQTALAPLLGVLDPELIAEAP